MRNEWLWAQKAQRVTGRVELSGLDMESTAFECRVEIGQQKWKH